MTIRCEPCIMRHLSEAVRVRASLDEVVEVIKVAVAMGSGPSLAYGAKAYKAAKEPLRAEARCL